MPGTADKNPRPKTTQPKIQPGGLQFTKTPSSTKRTNTWKPSVTNSSNDASRMLRNIGQSPNRLRVFRPAFGPQLAKTPNPPIEQTIAGQNDTNSSNESHRIFHNVGKPPNRFRVFRPAFNTRFAKTPSPTPYASTGAARWPGAKQTSHYHSKTRVSRAGITEKQIGENLQTISNCTLTNCDLLLQLTFTHTCRN